jgi:predicted TIM-barrel fold metal-dependent hydrolase
MKKRGCVALKVPVAYDRRLDFTETSKQAAQSAFYEDRSEADIKAFQDYLFFEICKMASEESLPIQVHTGMGRLRQSNAMWLREAIEKNPATKFVLLHCSYPWTQDISALLRYYPNVYPDLSYLPLLSTVACQHTLHDMIEGGTSEKLCWGCDTWTPEESYGSLLAFRHSMVRTMTEKVESGYLSLEDARTVMDNIAYHNAKSLYKL